jgi:hypothetical protein
MFNPVTLADKCIILTAHEEPPAFWVQTLFPRIKGLFQFKRGKGSQDEENGGTFPSEGTAPGKKPQESAPNITLNLHCRKRRDLYLAAICGILLQSGMLLFSGTTVYYPSLIPQFLKDKRHVRQYAFPSMATGTIILTIGMMICSAVVEQSTQEKEYIATEKYRVLLEQRVGEPKKLNARILWLQKSGVVGDQSFDSAVIFGRSKTNTRDSILSSRRKDPNDDSNNDSNDDPDGSSNEDSTGGVKSPPAFLGRIISSSRRLLCSTKQLLSPINLVTAGTATENFTTLGVVLGLSGFILQFQVGMTFLMLLMSLRECSAEANEVWMRVRACAV